MNKMYKIKYILLSAKNINASNKYIAFNQIN